jgi:hypothetical protein
MNKYLVEFETVNSFKKFIVKTSSSEKIEEYFSKIYLIPINNEIKIKPIDDNKFKYSDIIDIITI